MVSWIMGLIALAGIKTAERAAGTASMWWTYQPKEPEELRAQD